MWAFLLGITWFLASSANAGHSNGHTYIPMQCQDNVQICATSSPNQMFVAGKAQCFTACNMVEECGWVRFVDDTVCRIESCCDDGGRGGCELFTSQPNVTTNASGSCLTLWQKDQLQQPINLTQTCQGDPVDMAPPAGCSFPFTFNGQLLYNCTTNLTGPTTLSCISGNRTQIFSCSNSGFIAQNLSTTLAVPGQPNITVMSVSNWIVIVQRASSLTNTAFERSYVDYVNGFGSPLSDFWLGLESMHQLTNSHTYTLRWESYSYTYAMWQSAQYTTFRVANSSLEYTILTRGFSGDTWWYPNQVWDYVGDLNTCPFITTDHNPTFNYCVGAHGGGWWYSNCGVGLTGTYESLGRMMIRID